MEFKEYSIEELKCLGGQFFIRIDIQVKDTGMLQLEYMLVDLIKIEWFISLDPENYIFIARVKYLENGIAQVYIKEIQRIV